MKRPVVIGAAAVGILVVVGAAIAFAASSGDDGSSGTGASKTTTSTTKQRSTSGAETPSTTQAGAGTEPTTVDRSVPPDPKNAYQPVPLPPGISTTVARCAWSSSNGGELEAAGTITNAAGQDNVWLITAVWLQHNRIQDESIGLQSDVIDLAVGQSKPWHLSIGASRAPADLSCALEVQ
jgi:hypothetical protein